MKKKVIKIGIDFGTNYSFACFVHGDAVCSLVPSNETYGIPSVFFDDGKTKLVGRMAERRAAKRPECAVRSVKRKMKEKYVLQRGDTKYTPEMVIEEIISYIVRVSEQQLTNVYMEEYDEIEAVIAVPVDFSEPMINMIKEAAGRVRLSNGNPLIVTSLIKEPVAASIEYYGVKKEKDAMILAYDLGGGTFDAAIVEACSKGKTPYRVLDQEGDSALGGDNWDQALADHLMERYEAQTGKKPGRTAEVDFLLEARRVKEELTDLNESNASVMVEGRYFETDVTREEFEKLTEKLIQRSVEKVRDLVRRKQGLKIDHVVLTGGSSYMPQVRQALADSKIFGKDTDILMINPEHAIASGAARYAATLKRPDIGSVDTLVVEEEPMIEQISSHGYGIAYIYPGRGNKRLLNVLIPRGSKLPITVSTTSGTHYENQQESLIEVFETDYTGTEDVIALSEGKQIMSVVLRRQDKVIPRGTKSTETLSLGMDGTLTVTSKDHVKGITVDKSISITRKL